MKSIVLWDTRSFAFPLCPLLFFFFMKAHAKKTIWRLFPSIAKGADVNEASKDGFGPLFISCARGHLEVARLLLAKGAGVNKAANDGANPCLQSSEAEHKNNVEEWEEKEEWRRGRKVRRHGKAG
jgi:hypothetical protein